MSLVTGIAEAKGTVDGRGGPAPAAGPGVCIGAIDVWPGGKTPGPAVGAPQLATGAGPGAGAGGDGAGAMCPMLLYP